MCRCEVGLDAHTSCMASTQRCPVGRVLICGCSWLPKGPPVAALQLPCSYKGASQPQRQTWNIFLPRWRGNCVYFEHRW